MRSSKSIIFSAINENRSLLEPEAMMLLKEYSISVPEFMVVNTTEEAIAAAKKIGYPVVMKIISPDIIHKTDAGCVMLNLKCDEEVSKAFTHIVDNARSFKNNSRLCGVIIYPCLPKGMEIIVGMLDDAQFGKTIMFGLGGIFVEVLKDVTFRIVPLERWDAEEMIGEVKGYKMLNGIREEKPRDIEATVDMIMGVSRLCIDYPEIDEIDLNPVFVYEKGVMVADARILLKPSKEQ